MHIKPLYQFRSVAVVAKKVQKWYGNRMHHFMMVEKIDVQKI